MNFYKNFISIICLLFFSCMSDSMSHETEEGEISNENIDWFYDVDTEQLFLQIDLSNIQSELIEHFFIKLSPIHSDFQEIFDNGQGDDLIAGNQIYSIMINNVIFQENYVLNTKLNLSNDIIQELEYNINFNAPAIIDDAIYGLAVNVPINTIPSCISFINKCCNVSCNCSSYFVSSLLIGI